jgi:predicted RNase H-like nuclease (RuvC/YqgF family)
MALITVEELKAEATIREITLPSSETYLQEKINWAISHIQIESNRVFTDTIYTQSDEDHDCQSIYLHATPIKSIETFTIDGVDVEETEYKLNSSTGRVRLTTEPTGEYSYSITYTVCETDADIITEAKDICMDLTFAKIDGSYDEDEDISSMKSGNSQISYSKSTKQKIDNRIAKIARNEIFLGII